MPKLTENIRTALLLALFAAIAAACCAVPFPWPVMP